MEVVIHQAICGENNKKAWDLLKTTMQNISVAQSIAFKTDLQDQAGGINWIPTIRGFSHEDYFLLMKTFPDRSPEVRSGRAFSHVIIISRVDIASITDISCLFKFFPADIDKTISLAPITFSPNTCSPYSLSENLKSRFNKVIHGLVKSDSFKKTIIWVGEENYEDAISRLWQILSTSEKGNINFGINFNVSEVPSDKLNFITIPESIENKFVNAGFCIVRKNDSHVLTDFLEQFLAGDVNASKRIAQFQEVIEAGQLSRFDIENVAKGINTFENIEAIEDLKKLNTLSHIIAEYSPDEKKGSAFKARLVDKMSRLIVDGDVKEISLIKNFKTKSFRNSETIFALAITNWLKKYLFTLTENKKQDLTSLLKQLFVSTTSNYWTKLVSDQVNEFISAISLDHAAVILIWIQKDFQIFEKIQSYIDTSKESENHFVSQFPRNFDLSKFDQMKYFAVKRNWYCLHATLLSIEHPFELAIVEQLKVDTNPDHFEGIEILVEGAKSKTIINFSNSSGDKRMIKIAGKLCHKDPDLLDKLDLRNIHAQEIWLQSIQDGNKVTDGFKDPRKHIFTLFDTLADGSIINENLLDILGDTEFANLLEYSRREEIWSKLSSTINIKFLAKTASVLLESISKDSSTAIPADKILSNYIIKNAIHDFLYYNRSNIKSVLPIFISFKQIPENQFRDFLSNYHGELDLIDATQLGKLVYSRSYTNVASTIYYKSTSNNNWTIALAECYTTLSTFTQIIIGYSGLIRDIKISEDQWWSALTEIVCKLYPGGPRDKKIWIQSGGEEYDLQINGSGKEIWIDALKKLRNGGSTGITINKLWKKMVEDHPHNNELKTLNQLKNKE